ncbi:MAG: hypothetical protein AAGE52_33155 [Myxococcota bacterium]
MRYLLALTLIAACSGSEPEAPPITETSAIQPAVEEVAPAPEPGPGPRPESWVTSRVEEAQERMGASEAGRLVWQAIEAHGGLQSWLAKSTITFEFDYQPKTQPERRMHSLNRVDFWSARAHQQELDGGAGEEAVLGWDGTNAWIHPSPEAFPTTARFWALTPYYFVGMPFVAADPGTRYERLEDAELDGAVHQLVRLTYGDGVGDAPDDYYILYLHAETHRLSGLRYVVSYRGFFPEGGHSPEKLMRYSDYEDVDGLQFAQRLDTATWDSEAATPGDVVTEIAVDVRSVGDAFEPSLFDPIEGASVSTTIE